jgi:hypothetical protein
METEKAAEGTPRRLHSGDRLVMGLLSKLFRRATNDGAAPRMSEPATPLEMLDDVISDMAAQRDEAMTVLEQAPPGRERDELVRAIALLQSKLDEARARRTTLLARFDRKERSDALVREMRALREEMEAAGPEADEARKQALRARRDRLLAEAEELKKDAKDRAR